MESSSMQSDNDELREIARELRRTALTMIYKAGSGHPGSSLSEAEIIAALYFRVLNINPNDPSWLERDRFILSKGHGSPTLYAALSKRGYFDSSELDHFREYGSLTPSYPDFKTPGIDMVSGSLGNGLSAGASMAKMSKLMGIENRIYVLLGDGELEEGLVWEAAMFASHHKLDNLTAIIDRNKLQINGTTEELMSLEPLASKWAAFGWETCEIDGNDIDEVVEALSRGNSERMPRVVIAQTTKGKGVSFMEGNKEWHTRQMTSDEYSKAMYELGAKDC